MLKNVLKPKKSVTKKHKDSDIIEESNEETKEEKTKPKTIIKKKSTILKPKKKP